MFLRGTLQAQRAEDWCAQRETLQTQLSNEATDGLAPSVLDSFSGAARVASYEFPPASEEDPRRETSVSDSHLAPEAWCSRKGTLQAQRAEDWCSQKGTLQTHKCPTRLPTVGTVGVCRFSGAVRADSRVFLPTSKEKPEARNHGFGFASCSRSLVFPDGDITDPNPNTAFDPSLEYSTDKVVLFRQPPSYFPPWSPSSFAVDKVPYSCAEQYMMAEKASFFQDHRAVGLIMSSPSPSTRKRIGRGVRKFDTGVGDREKKNAVLSGTYAELTHNSAKINHL